MELGRIETALARLEAAARPPERNPQDLATDPGQRLVELEASNTRLREAVAASLRQIDALIERHGGLHQ